MIFNTQTEKISENWKNDFVLGLRQLSSMLFYLTKFLHFEHCHTCEEDLLTVDTPMMTGSTTLANL